MEQDFPPASLNASFLKGLMNTIHKYCSSASKAYFTQNQTHVLFSSSIHVRIRSNAIVSTYLKVSCAILERKLEHIVHYFRRLLEKNLVSSGGMRRLRLPRKTFQFLCHDWVEIFSCRGSGSVHLGFVDSMRFRVGLTSKRESVTCRLQLWHIWSARALIPESKIQLSSGARSAQRSFSF